MFADACVWGHEPRVDRERVAAEPWPAPVSQYLHGVSGGRTHAGPPHQKRSARGAQDGRQFPQVIFTGLFRGKAPLLEKGASLE